jgi:hypothetical protein
MRWVIASILITLLFVPVSHAQTPAPAQAPKPPELNAVLLAQEWVDRLNALDDWHITMDGKEEGIDKLVDHFMERLTPDALVEVPPYDEEQIGPVMLVGTQQVKQWVDRFAKTKVELLYLLKRQTEKAFEGERMVYSKVLPWGGLGVSFPIIAAYSQREDRRRFMEVGAVFIQYDPTGKIQRFRLIQSEKDEVLNLGR